MLRPKEVFKTGRESLASIERILTSLSSLPPRARRLERQRIDRELARLLAVYEILRRSAERAAKGAG